MHASRDHESLNKTRSQNDTLHETSPLNETRSQNDTLHEPNPNAFSSFLLTCSKAACTWIADYGMYSSSNESVAERGAVSSNSRAGWGAPLNRKIEIKKTLHKKMTPPIAYTGKASFSLRFTQLPRQSRTKNKTKLHQSAWEGGVGTWKIAQRFLSPMGVLLPVRKLAHPLHTQTDSSAHNTLPRPIMWRADASRRSALRGPVY